MMRLKMFKPSDRTIFVLLGIAASLIVIFLYWAKPRFLVEVDLKALDAMFVFKKPVKPTKDVVIVAVDERSVKEVGRWPWSRKKTAALIAKLTPARVVAVDMVYSEPESKEADTALQRAISQSGNVVLGYFFRDDASEAPSAEALSQINKSKINLVSSIDRQDAFDQQLPLVEFGGVETNLTHIGKAAAGYGVFNIIPQEDGIYRVSNLVFAYKGGLYPTLALSAIKHYYNGDITLNTASYGIDSAEVNGVNIPLNEEGAFQLNFYGRGGSFTTYPAVDVMTGKVAPEALKDKLVFVGVTEKGIYDIRPTPVDSLFPGVEILATIAGNIIEGRYLIHDTRVVMFDAALIVFTAILLAVVLSFVHATFLSLMVFGLIAALVVLFDFYLFALYNVKPAVVFPIISLAFTYLANEAYRNIIVEKKSRYLKKAFSTYVSPQLVAELVKNPDALKLGGEKREVSVLFSDIRGFTTLSETLSPEALVALLNEYLSPMTRVVLEQEGTLDKYIGDAIMAVFNAPVIIENHPKKACTAAIGMIARLKELNDSWKAKGYPAIDIGVGINTGEAVVGNMGADLRFDYTAIGDTVNLASRLEGMNKMYGTHIVISEFTQAHVKDDFIFRELDLVRVKGKLKPIVMYELVGERSRGAEVLVKDFNTALDVYKAKEFDSGIEAFKNFLGKYPDDGPAKLYVQRCAEYVKNPPPADWDGVFVAKTK